MNGFYQGHHIPPPQQEQIAVAEPSPPAEPFQVVNKVSKTIEVPPHQLAVWLHRVHGGDLKKSLVAFGDNINYSDAKCFAEEFLLQKQYWRHLRLREFFMTALLFES